MWGSYPEIHKAIFYLLKGDHKPAGRLAASDHVGLLRFAAVAPNLLPRLIGRYVIGPQAVCIKVSDLGFTQGSCVAPFRVGYYHHDKLLHLLKQARKNCMAVPG